MRLFFPLPSAPRLLRCLAAVLLVSVAPLLTGCFVSDQPLLTSADADFPFNKVVVVSSLSGEEITIARRGDVYIGTSETESEGLEFLFKRLDDNLFLTQVRDTTHTPPFVYYGYIEVDPEAKIARAYKVAAGDGDWGDGLERCRDDRDICIVSLDAYRSFAERAIEQGAAPTIEFRIEQRE